MSYGNMRRFWVLWCLIAELTGCASGPGVGQSVYSRQAQEYGYALRSWSLDGRLAVVSNKDSWSANLAWQHDKVLDQLKLSGPLGQGGAVIRLSKDYVALDRGGTVQTSSQPNQFIAQQLGMFVPIEALKYWIVGLPEPNQSIIETEGGFKQGQWLVMYKEMQSVGNQLMPRKIMVSNDQVRLKVMIDRWNLNDIKPE